MARISVVIATFIFVTILVECSLARRERVKLEDLCGEAETELCYCTKGDTETIDSSDFSNRRRVKNCKPDRCECSNGEVVQRRGGKRGPCEKENRGDTLTCTCENGDLLDFSDPDVDREEKKGCRPTECECGDRGDPLIIERGSRRGQRGPCSREDHGATLTCTCENGDPLDFSDPDVDREEKKGCRPTECECGDGETITIAKRGIHGLCDREGYGDTLRCFCTAGENDDITIEEDMDRSEFRDCQPDECECEEEGMRVDVPHRPRRPSRRRG